MVHTNIIARIERYEDGMADLEPLFLDDDGQPYSKIVNARAVSQRFLMPKNMTLEGGNVNHSAIPENGTSHTINSGNIVISRNVGGGKEEIELFPHYEKGDIVLVAIIERDFSDAVDGRIGNGGSDAKYELTSAVIIGKVM